MHSNPFPHSEKLQTRLPNRIFYVLWAHVLLNKPLHVLFIHTFVRHKASWGRSNFTFKYHGPRDYSFFKDLHGPHAHPPPITFQHFLHPNCTNIYWYSVHSWLKLRLWKHHIHTKLYYHYKPTIYNITGSWCPLGFYKWLWLLLQFLFSNLFFPDIFANCCVCLPVNPDNTCAT